MADLTAIILTKDEEKNIARCLKSLDGFAKRRIVVDSGSKDGTRSLARSLGGEVHTHPFVNYAKQWNWALDELEINTKWVLRIDADEAFPALLCAKLEKLMEEHADDDVNGFLMESNFYFMGKHIKHGGPKKRKIMIFRVGTGRIEDRRMDEHTVVNGGRILELKERFDHYDFKDIDSYIAKLNWYATREMQDYFLGNDTIDDVQDKKLAETRKKKFGFYYRLPLFLRCMLLFIYNYIFRLGFLDGTEGFIYHWLYQRFYRTLVDAKIYEQKKNPRPFIETGSLGEEKLEEDS